MGSNIMYKTYKLEGKGNKLVYEYIELGMKFDRLEQMRACD